MLTINWKNNAKKNFILILILFISIGFAYLSTNLNIGTIVGYSANSWDIYFDGVKEETYKTDIINSTTINNKTTLNFSINLKQPLSKYIMYAKIVNNGTIDAMLDSWNISNTLSNEASNIINVNFSYADGSQLSRYDLLQASGFNIIKVEVYYNDNISNSDLLATDGNADFEVTLNYIQSRDNDYVEKGLDPTTKIKYLNTEGISISTTDHEDELRFIGANPNNYVLFNNQKWRIIGIFDGYLKIIQDSIGSYSWDTSKDNVNYGWGINQWGPSTYTNGDTYNGSDLMKLLNPGYETNSDLKCTESSIIYDNNGKLNCGDNSNSYYSTGLVNNSLYWNATSGFCYIDGNYLTYQCDFSQSGLKDEKSKSMIDNHLWSLGTIDNAGANIWDMLNANSLYNYERSSNLGKTCVNSTICSDTVNRTINWTGKVGLIYPSDWVYATGGGTEGRDNCLSYMVGYADNNLYHNWNNTYNQCYIDNWLKMSEKIWTITPRAYDAGNRFLFVIDSNDMIYHGSARFSLSVRPVVYLKNNVKFTNVGDGSLNNPYNLIMN